MAKESKTPSRNRAAGAMGSPVTSPSLTPMEEMERMFQRILGSGWLGPLRGDQALSERLGMTGMQPPRVDVVERDKEVLVRAELPGVKSKDLDVSVTDNTVTIKGESGTEREDNEGDYHRREITYGAFARTIPLPAAIDADKAQASFKEGILNLTLPKVNQARRRRVEVK